MAGLDNYLSTLKDNAGMAGGFNQGIRDRAGRDTTLAGLAQKQAELQRYTGETPSYLQKSNAQARTAELANVQGEADLAAGVPGAKAGQSMQEAQLKAKQAEQALKQMPAQAKLQMMDQMAKEVESFNQLGLQALQFSGSTGEAIQRMAEQYPDITKDPQFTQWAKQYGNMPRDKALAAFKFEMQKYASGISTTREKFQTEALQEDQKQQGRMELGAQTGQFGLQEAQQRASSTSSKPTSDQFLYEQIKAANPGMSEPELANAFVQARTITTKETPSILSPTGTVTTTTRKGSAGQGSAPDIRSMVEASGAKYEPNKFDYRINPETGKVQKKPKGN